MGGLSRRRAVLGVVSLVLLTLFGVGGGLGLVVLGTGPGWRFCGGLLLVGVAGFVWCLLGVRSPRAAATPTTWGGRPALLLPRRPGHVAALCLGTVALGLASALLGWGMLQAGETGSGRRSPWAAVLAGVVLLGYGAWMSVRAALGRGRVLVTDEGLVLGGLAYRTRVVPWRDAAGFDSQPGLAGPLRVRLPARVLLADDGGVTKPYLVQTSRVAWRHQQTRSVLLWLLKNREGRDVRRRLTASPAPESDELEVMAEQLTAAAVAALPPQRR